MGGKRKPTSGVERKSKASSDAVQVLYLKAVFIIQPEKRPCVNVSDPDSVNPHTNQGFFVTKLF